MLSHWNNNNFNVRDTTAGSLTNSAIKAAAGAGISIYVTDLTINAGGTSRTWQLLDGSGGTALYTFVTTINTAMSINFMVPIKVTANTALCITNGGASTGSSIYINGFVGKS